jgi:hypothetical protein
MPVQRRSRLDLRRPRCGERLLRCFLRCGLPLFPRCLDPLNARRCVIRLGGRHDPDLMPHKIDARRALAACPAIGDVSDVGAHRGADLLLGERRHRQSDLLVNAERERSPTLLEHEECMRKLFAQHADDWSCVDHSDTASTAVSILIASLRLSRTREAAISLNLLIIFSASSVGTPLVNAFVPAD